MQHEENWKDLKDKISGVSEKYGAKVLKVKDTGNLLFIELLLDGIYSEIDVNYKNYYTGPVMRQYENLDGTFFDILTLPPEALILEKINAYNGRRYLTDLYDMKILLDNADLSKIKSELKEFKIHMKPPKEKGPEEDRLKGLVYEGPIPSFKTLADYIKGRIE